MFDLSNISDADLAKEVKNRKIIKRARAWSKIEKVKKELFQILHDKELLSMKWSSLTDTIEDRHEEYFQDLWGACGGNDIYGLTKVDKAPKSDCGCPEYPDCMTNKGCGRCDMSICKYTGCGCEGS